MAGGGAGDVTNSVRTELIVGGVHAVSSIPATLAAIWSADGHAMPRVTILSIGGAVIGAAPLIASPLAQISDKAGASPEWLVLMLVPHAFRRPLPHGLLPIPAAIR